MRPLFYELFHIYKIHRLLFVQLGLVLIAAGVMPLVEKDTYHATIKNYGNGLWWALVTVTSTGYGDYVPVTWIGKVIGVVLMFSGIVLFSTMIALVASYFAYRRTKRHNVRSIRQMEDMEERLSSMEKKLDYLVKNGAEEK